MYCQLLLIFLLSIPRRAQGSPITSSDDLGSTSIVGPTPTTTVTIDASPAPSLNASSVQPPGASVSAVWSGWGPSYFYVHNSCYDNKDLPDDQKNFGNRGKYLERAITDATEIARAVAQWPSVGTDASDLYFGRGFHKSSYQPSVSTNLDHASKWSDGTYWGWLRPYIVSFAFLT